MKKTIAVLFIAPLLMIGIYGFDYKTEEARKISEEIAPKTIKGLSKAEKLELVKHLLMSGDCSFDGIELKGKVQIVDAFPDIKVQIVDAFPDIKVKEVTAFPDNCGEWQYVDAFPDFKIQIVDAFPDIKVQIVDAFPGMQ